MPSLPNLSCYGLLSLLAVSATLSHAETLPIRTTPIPQTTDGVPHVQIGVDAVPELTEALLNYVAQFPGVSLGPTRVSMPGGIGFQLEEDLPLARPDEIVGGREFAHIHPDGSLHASLNPDVALAAIQAGWAIAHPWADQRAGWEGFVMIYTPTTQAELDAVLHLVRGSYTYITGQSLPETSQ
ncbi:luciferase domain-containing protein [Sulfitobacter sp. SK012]|uniref:luciferase domain-containing protein n=1 Tax=Sulfitobacter sp. SK012 TaxID=1389005 RepID=UPI001C1F235F|nr:luciferase family protein [Sulfitobacter sp. SK012]